MHKTFLRTLCLSLLALIASSAWAQNVAKIGTTEYATFADALSAVQDGDVIYLLADADASAVAFTPCNGKHVVIAGSAGTETLNMGNGAKGGIQNADITFLNLKMQIRHTLTSGIWYTEGMYHAKKIKYENVVFDGVISTYNDVDFLNCTFTSNPQNMEYTTWNYGGTQIFKGCKFLAASAGTKSFIKLYNQGASASVAVVDCEFTNPTPLPSGWKGGDIYNSNPDSVASQAKQYVSGNKVNGETKDDIVKYSKGGASVPVFNSPEEMGITLPTPTILANVAKIGDTEYASLESAVAAAQKAGSGVIELLSAYDRYPQAWVTPCVIDAPETMTSSYTFHAFNPENGDEALAVAYNSDPSALTTGQQKRAQEVLNQVGNFSNWNADFEVSFDADMTAEDFSIGGQYGNISWIDGLSANLTGNTPMRLLGSVGMSFTYEYMMMDVFQFNCGITGKNMSKLAGHTFSVDLCMYDPNNENVKILIGTTKYTFPAVNVAKIDTTEYTSLADAIAAVPTDGTEPTTITMIADEAIVGNAGVTVVKGQNIVLDLNGKTVSNLVNESKASQIITNYGTLTITGNGTMTNALTDGTIAGDWPTYNYVTNLISNLGTLTIENGTFDNTQDSGITYALDNNSNGVPAIATINGGTFISAGNSAVRMFCNSTTAANTLTINDGYFAGNYYAVSVSNASGATKVGTLNINGGEFESIADEYNACVANWESNKSSNIAVNITGGKFNDYVLIASNPAITGGLYKYDKYTDPDDGTVYDLHSYPAEGYEVIANTDEATKEAYPWTIGKKSVPVAKIDTTEYTSLADAIAAVPTDGTEPTTITMIANEAIVGNAGVTVAAGQNIVLDLNGKTISNLVNESKASQIITNYGTLTITDSSNPSTGKMTNAVQDGTAVGEWWSNPKNNYATNVITNRGNLTINGGEIYETAAGSICYPIDNNSSSSAATLTVNGGYIHKDTGTAVRQFCNSTTMDNTVNVNGGTIEGGYAAIWIQLPGGGQAKKAALNVTGGTLKGTYAFYDYTYGDVFDAVQYNLNGGTFDGYIFSYGANMTITGGTYKGEIDIKQAKPSHLSVTGGKFSGDIYASGDNASKGFITGGVYKDYTFVYDQVTYGCYWYFSIDPRYEAIYNTDEATKDEYPYTVGLKEQIIMPEVEEETLEITQDDEQQTEIPEEKQQEVTAAVIAALTQNSSVNNMTAEETNINNAVPVSETQDESERRLKVELTSAVVSAETITEQTTITSTTVKGATFEVKPVYVYEEGGVTKTEIVRNEDITAPITFRLAVQKDIQDDCAKVWHQAVLYDLNGKAYADPDSPKEYLGVFPIQQADNGEKYIQLSASKFSFYNYLTKSMEETTLVAQIGEAKFETLAEAIAAVKDGETIKMIADVTGANGISVESGKNFIIDFDGHTYTFGGDGAGSANTKTCGFQLLKGSNITFKNGTINCDEENKNRTWTTGSTELKGIAMLIQNYADLTLDSMTIDGTNVARNGAATRYVLSNNSGEVHYTGATTITAATGDKAFDACKYGTYPVPTVTIDDAQVTINGNIEAAGGKLVITNGTVNGTISTDTGYTQGDIAISGGSFSEVVASEYCATGFQPVTEKDAQGMYSVEEKNVVLHVYGFENKADKKDMTISEFLTAQQTYPNAMAVTESTNAEDVAELHNVILDYTVGKGGHYYECENFIIDDMADFWYSPVSFYAVAGNYTRKDLTLYNSVCVPFDVTTDNAPSGATFLQYRYSDENKANVYFEIQDHISAGQGFLMQTTAGETWTVTFENTEIRNTIITGAMSGSYETKTIGEGYFKVNSQGDKFTKTIVNSKVYPFRSYLDLTGEILGGAPDVSSLSIVIDEQGTTGINAATSQDIQSVYGLNGVKRNALQRGVNIVRTSDGYKKIIK